MHDRLKLLLASVLAVAMAGALACSEPAGDEPVPGPTGGSTTHTGGANTGGTHTGGGGGSAPAPLTAEAGFVELAARTVTVQAQHLDVPAQRLWYSFHPADTDAELKPLAVFFNGLSAATSGILFAFNTAPWTLDPEATGGEDAIPNPHRWNQFANTLHIDMDFAGFSYGLDPNEPPSGGVCMSQNAANVLLVVLRFLEEHPAIRFNRVILVAESWGGVRATLMLRSLLDYGSLVDGDNLRGYQDSGLFDAIAAHYEAAFGEDPGSGTFVEPTTIATQFGHQVLIQPAVGGNEADMPKPANPDCLPPPYDLYQCDEPAGWSDALELAVQAKLIEPDVLSTVVAVDVTTIELLHASQRQDAFRVLAGDGTLGPDAPLFEAAFGTLSSRDSYFLTPADLFYGAQLPVGPSGVAGELTTVEEVDLLETTLGAEFLANVVHVQTFITDAALDRFITAAWIGPGLLAKHPDILEAALYNSTEPQGAARPGQLVLDFQPTVAMGATRTIRMPPYALAGHMVTYRQPGELLEDVMTWYADSSP